MSDLAEVSSGRRDASRARCTLQPLHFAFAVTGFDHARAGRGRLQAYRPAVHKV